MPEDAPRPWKPQRHHGVTLPWSKRLNHFTWSWFECTMSTGAIATLLGQQPNSFTGLKTIGKTFFLVDIVLFLIFCICITYRFSTNTRSLNRSLHHPHESFFFGSFFVSIALIIYCMELYAVPSTGPWMIKTLQILFWAYAGVVILVAVFQYHIIFDRERLPVTEAMPAWILPVYPFLVLGPLGGTLLKSQPPESGFPIFIGSIAFQGLGWTVALFMLTIYVTRLVNSELPEPSKKPGMYVAVGPAAYTANTFVSLAMYAPKHVPENFLGITSVPVGDIFKAVGVAAGIFMWLISFWFSALTTVSIATTIKEMHFTLNYWAFIFPNAGLVIALIQIASALQSEGMKWICSVATIVLVVTWLLVAYSTIRGITKKLVLWPGMDEDIEDMQGHGQDRSQEEASEEHETTSHDRQTQGETRRRHDHELV